MAIARVASAYLSNVLPGTTLTAAFNCGTGADYLVVAVHGNDPSGGSGDNITGVTYGGVAMTLLKKHIPAASAAIERSSYLFGLAAPASGSNNVVVTSSPSGDIVAFAASYSGVSATGQPDASNGNDNTGSSITTSVTVVAANSWAILVAGQVGAPVVAGTGATLVVADSDFTGKFAFLDSNGAVAAGSYSMTTTATSSGRNWQAMASLAPASGAPSIGATDQSANRIFQRTAGGTTKSVTFSGTYGGSAPSSIEVKIVNASGGALVQDWTALTGATIAGGAWSGTLSVLQGGWYHFLARSKDGGGSVIATSSETANSWGVGILIGMIGQSNMRKMFDTVATPPTTDTNTKRYNGSWGAVVGNGAIRFANLMYTAKGIPIGVLDYAVNGSGLHQDFGGNGYWMDLTAGSPWKLFEAAIAAIGGDLEYILWHQGESDAINSVSKANYKADLDTLYSRILTATGRNTGTLKFGSAIVGNINDATATDASTDPIRQGQLEWIRDTSGVFYAGSSVDMVRTDAFHWTAPYYERMARRYTQAVLKQLGSVSFGANGPKVASASLSGSNIDLTITHDAGTALKELDGTTDGGALTGFDVSNDNFATTLTISSTSFASGKVRLSMAAPPTGTVKVRYQYGENPTITNTVHDDTSPQSDTVGLPLQPTIGSLTVGVGTRKWRIPTNAADGTVRKVRVFNGNNNTIDDSNASVTASGGFFKFACANQATAIDTKKFVTIDNWDGDTATTTIRGSNGIATVIEE